MSLFLDKNYISTKYDTKYPMDCLVHTYNKKYFNSQEETLDMLMNKVLLPGEVAFGYYYDSDAEYGTNAIFAVGPLSHGSGNIIFKNSTDIDKLVKDLSTYITSEKENIDLHLQNAIDNIDELINNANNYFDSFTQNINDIINNANDVIDRLNVYDSRINDILIFNNDIKDDLDDLIILLNDKIDDVSNYIINLIGNSFTGDSEIDSPLYIIINEFKQSIENKTQNLDEINERLTLLSQQFNNFKNQEFKTLENYIVDMDKRLKVVEHLIYHILEIPNEDTEQTIIDILNQYNSSILGNRFIFNDLND